MYNPQLETFIRVADAGSFSKAAGEAYITSTAVIKQINILEADLGLQLFVRTRRGIALTESGKSLYKDAKHLIQYSKDAVARAKDAVIDKEQIIRLGSSPMTPGQFLIELWSKLHEKYSSIRFQLVPFDNTPENAREILKNLGADIDIVAGLFDDRITQKRGCAALELSRTPICCAVPILHKLASKHMLTIQDLYGENFMLIKRGWNSYVDILRDDILEHHKQITVVDFDFYNTSIFNQCENSDNILMAVDCWGAVHPLLKILPIEWNYTIPFGILYSPTPSNTVQKFLNTVQSALELKTR